MKRIDIVFLTMLCVLLSCVCRAEAVDSSNPSLALTAANDTVALDSAQSFETMPIIPTHAEIKANRLDLVDAIAGEKFQVGFATVIGAAVVFALLIW